MTAVVRILQAAFILMAGYAYVQGGMPVSLCIYLLVACLLGILDLQLRSPLTALGRWLTGGGK